jgi:hypothetical protein
LSTTAPGDPDQIPNAIPYNVGEPIGLPNGWRLEVTRVHRPYAASGLPALSTGQQYVGVDLTMKNDGTETTKVDAARIFALTDSAGGSHGVVGGPAGATDLDGTYSPGTTRSGRLVFEVPVGKNLLMQLDGPVIHTQRSVYQIDPPTHPPVD